MRRTKNPPGVVSYYETLQRIFGLESEVLTGVLPHSGERGRNDEERFRSFLSRVLPRRFSVGSGFIVCSEPDIPTSSQTDIVLFDEVHNSPLHRELAAFVYPVEMVYGTVEVKGTLTPANLLKTCHDIGRVRVLGLHQYYVEYTNTAVDPARPEQKVVDTVERRNQTPPRAFVFAYEKRGWKNIDALEASLRTAVKETGAHVHGLAVLGDGWHLAQRAYTDPAQFNRTEGNALMQFVRGMLHSITSRRIVQQASIDRYLRAPAEQDRPSGPTVASQPKARNSRRRRRRSSP